MNEIRDVEIFRVGTWKRARFTTADLDGMVRGFHELPYLLPLKLGHGKDARRCGWVTSLRRVGDRLIASFSAIPDDVYEIIQKRGLPAVSAEVGFRQYDTSFPRVLRAVALLATHEKPAVKGLRPVCDSLPVLTEAEADDADALRLYHLLDK